MSDQFNIESIDAEPIPPVPELANELTPGDEGGVAKPDSDSTGQHSSLSKVQIVATAHDLNGREPLCVIEFDHASGLRVRRLVPLNACTPIKRARAVLIKAGTPPSFVSDDATVAALVNEPPSVTGLHDVPHGWMNGCDIGNAYRRGETVFSSSGSITVYADGPVPEPKQHGDVGKLLEALAGDRSPGTAILIAAHLASPLVHLLGSSPIVIVASGAPPSEIERLATLAQSAFDTRLTALHAPRKDTDDALVDFTTAQSRSEAFAHVRIIDKARTAGSRRGSKTGVPTPVTLILTAEADSPCNPALPMPPPGCVEIHLDALGPNAQNNVAQTSPNATSRFHAGAANTYIEASLRNQSAIARNANEKMPGFTERYLAMMKHDPSVDVETLTANSFALMRFALMCGKKFGIVPWDGNAADTVMDACVARWVDHRQQHETTLEGHVVDAVKKLAMPGSPNQQVKSDGRKVRFETINGRELLLIAPDIFNSAIVGLHDKRRVLGILLMRELLVTNGDGNQYLVRIDGNRSRFYAIDRAALKLFTPTLNRS